MSPPRFSLAHVTPYPWESQDNEINAHVARLAGEQSKRGHRVLILAPSRSPERVRESRREVRAAKSRPESLLDGTNSGTPRVVAIGEVLDVARTLEELLGRTPLDFVHVH
ncbi:MAG TPA: histidinol-phosphatase, partial [Solirubrobacteraceae bacterium]|nr:histidinol-phosphatase [Solirubrobacteraceae bacterium]